MKLPEANDPDAEDSVYISVKLDAFRQWITYEERAGKVVASPTKTTPVGLKRITIVVSDGKAQIEYVLMIQVKKATPDPIAEKPKEDPKKETIAEEEKDDEGLDVEEEVA